MAERDRVIQGNTYSTDCEFLDLQVAGLLEFFNKNDEKGLKIRRSGAENSSGGPEKDQNFEASLKCQNLMSLERPVPAKEIGHAEEKKSDQSEAKWIDNQASTI